MKVRIYIFFFLLLFTSCKSHLFYLDSYSRDGKRTTFHKKEYKKPNSIFLNSIVFCKQKKDPTYLQYYKTGGDIIFNINSLEKIIRKSLKNSFINITHDEHIDDIKWSNSCKNIDSNTFRNKEILPNSFSSKRYHIQVSFNIDYLIKKNLESDVSGGFTYADLGDDLSEIKYKLVVALFFKDDLIYMDNHAHWTKIYSKRGEKLHYEVPQNIIDSLVTKSLAEYKKRLKT